MTQLHDLTALEQAAAVRKGEVGPVELVRHYLDRIDEHGAQLGAFVTVTPERALAQARDAERAVREGGDGDGLPPLHGVPTAIKDLARTAGVRTTMGSAAFADQVPTTDDWVVTRLRAAGTISLGKTNTPELGAPCYTEPDVAPPARTPWDLARSAGGSSGGAAAAVSAGLVPFAHGSDGGGSIRIPASACGLFGIKVSRGRISKGPELGDLTGLSWDGPLARTVADAAAMLDAMAGYQPGDPHWAPPLPAGETFLGHAGRDPGRLRIGRYVDNQLDAPVHPDCRQAWESASALLEGLGHEVVDAPLPTPDELVALTGEEGLRVPLKVFGVLWAASYAAAPVPADREHLLRPLTAMLRARGRRVSAVEWAEAVRRIQRLSRVLVASTLEYDAVLTPTLAQLPAPIGGLRDDDDPAGDFREQGRFTPYTSLYNITGQPAVNVPLHWNGHDLPVGVQLVGRPGDEAGLIRLSAQVEAARPWQSRRPDCW